MASAPSIPLPRDEYAVVADQVVNGLRTIHLRLRSPRKPSLLNVYVENSVEIASATINGRRFDYDPPAPGRAASGWGFTGMNLPDGVDLVLETRSNNTLQMNLVSYTDGLPNVPGMVVKPRPQNLVPAINSDLTRVNQTIELPVPQH